ncbi:MAG: hypothetical protein J6W94_06755 [Bacteroidales bacterium]|nr:hypothetical protein [Bacteroidales bacterium]
MKQSQQSILAALCLAALLPQSCSLFNIEEVNEIDMTSALAKGTEVTVVKEKKITLGDFLDFGAGSGANGIVKVSADGEYSIEYNLEPQSIGDGFTFDASQFSLNVNNSFNQTMSLSEATIPAKTPISYNEADKDAVQAYFQNFATGVDVAFFESLLSQEYKFNFNIDFTISGFPELIKTFKKADLDGNFTFNLVPAGIPFQKFVFKQGAKINLPAFLKFSSCSNQDFTLVDGNKLVANKDVNVPMGTGLTFTLALQSLDMGNGVATAGSLPLVGAVAVDGTISLDPADFTGPTDVIDLADYPVIVPLLSGSGSHTIVMVQSDTPLGSFTVSCAYQAQDVALKDATIQLSKDAIPAFDGNYGFDIGNLPDELSADGNTVELADVEVNMTVNSTLPFAFGLNANLDAIGNRKYQLGPLNFAANAETKYILGDFAKDEIVDGIYYKKVEGLGQILNPVPSRIEVKDFDITFDENQWITVESGKNYGGTFLAGVKAPISFTSNTSLSLGYELNDLNVDLSVAGDYIKGDTKAVVKLQAVNEIPFKFALSITAQDADKNPIQGVSITPDVIEVGAGTIAQPVTSTPEITIILPSGSKLIKGISIDFSATVDSEHAGTPLNKNQSLTLKDVRLSLPDGITMDLKDLAKK